MSSAFVHGQRITIQNAADSSFLDLSESKHENQTKILTFNKTGNPNQTWTVGQEACGFRLTSMHPTKVIDLNAGNCSISLYQFHGGVNQQFYTVQIPNCPGMFHIKCAHNHFALRNQGKGKQVMCVAPDIRDQSQMWRIIGC